ncbi:MAG: FkbM family methyltransferase [Myxococcota bacterium]
MAKRRIRGAHRILDLAHRVGMLDVVMQYEIAGVRFDVPLDVTPEWNADYIATYDEESVSDIARWVRAHGEAIFVDCGAHLGVISIKVATRCGANLKQVVCIEPNPSLFGHLSANVARSPVSTRAMNAAVGETSGRGKLVSPPYDPSPEARYMVRDAHGDIEITALDDLELPEGVGIVIKIDVEGGELDVVRGAQDLLARSNGFAVTIEAHPDVVERTGIEPCAIARALHGIRPCRAHLVGGGAEVDINQPLFEQIGRAKCDLFITSENP